MSKDKVTEALVQALKLAIATPYEQRLCKSGKLDGLFPSRAGANGEAAALAVRDELLEVVRTEERGKSTFEWVTITPKGVEFLHEHESPIHALKELQQTLQCNQEAIPQWLADMQRTMEQIKLRMEEDAQKWMSQLELLNKRVCEALKRLEIAAPVLPDELLERFPWSLDALLYLDRRESTGEEAQHCPLPELFSAVRREAEQLSLGEFHNGLRRLQAQRAVQLLPFENNEGLPQPEYALFDGAHVFYFVARAA